MATYKDIYYADTSEKLSVANISYAEAVSIGDKIDSIKADTAFAVADEAARNALYPTPSQGDAVWRTDLNIEQRYYGLYSANNKGGRSIAGWYAATSSYSVVIPTSATVTGTGATSSINEVGDVSFTNATSITINNCFPASSLATGYYDRYKIVIDVNSINPNTTYTRWQYTAASSPVSTTYYYAANGFYNAGILGGTSNGSSCPLNNSTSNHPSSYVELNIGAWYGYPALIGVYKMFRSNSTMSASSTFNEVSNISGHVYVADEPDGIKIFPNNGTSTMSGTIKVYGIR
jgi:hypothetical protein